MSSLAPLFVPCSAFLPFLTVKYRESWKLQKWKKAIQSSLWGDTDFLFFHFQFSFLCSIFYVLTRKYLFGGGNKSICSIKSASAQKGTWGELAVDATILASGWLIQLLGVHTVLFIMTNFILHSYHASRRHTRVWERLWNIWLYSWSLILYFILIRLIY